MATLTKPKHNEGTSAGELGICLVTGVIGAIVYVGHYYIGFSGGFFNYVAGVIMVPVFLWWSLMSLRFSLAFMSVASAAGFFSGVFVIFGLSMTFGAFAYPMQFLIYRAREIYGPLGWFDFLYNLPFVVY